MARVGGTSDGPSANDQHVARAETQSDERDECTRGFCPVKFESIGIDDHEAIGADNMATDRTNLFWFAYSLHGPWPLMEISMAREIEGTPKVLATYPKRGGSIALNSSRLFWSVGGRIMSLPRAENLDARNAETLFDGTAQVTSIAASDSDVYWTSIVSTDHPYATTGQTMKRSLLDGTTNVISSGQRFPRHLRLNRTAAFWTTTYGRSEGGAIAKVPLSGGKTVVLAKVRNRCTIAVDEDQLYWSDREVVLDGFGSVQRMPVDGGASVSLTDPNEVDNGGEGIALDDDTIYWSTQRRERDGTPATVVRRPKARGAVVTLAVGPISSSTSFEPDQSLLLIGDNIYWKTLGGGLMRTKAR